MLCVLDRFPISLKIDKLEWHINIRMGMPKQLPSGEVFRLPSEKLDLRRVKLEIDDSSCGTVRSFGPRP
jgi:hypothetical protein